MLYFDPWLLNSLENNGLVFSRLIHGEGKSIKLKTVKKILTNSTKEEKKQISHDIFWKLLFNFVIPTLWSLMRPIFSVMAKRVEAFYPEQGQGHSFILLEPESSQVHIQNFADGLKEWIDRRVKPQSVVSVKSLLEIAKVTNPSVLIISYDWMLQGFLGSGFSFQIFKVAYLAKKKKHKVWVIMADSFDQRFVIPATFLVAYCGGSTVMLQNTKNEAKEFGLVYPSDPQLWPYSISTIIKFSAGKPFPEREKMAVIAMSGEIRRILMMKDLQANFLLRGWQVKSTDHSLSWDNYVDLIKSSQITVTTCWLHQIHINGSRKNRRRLPDTSLTGRVLEGFASSSVVFTTPSSVLEFLGFKPGIHYIVIPKKFDEFVFPSFSELERIGKAGHDHFLLVKYS